MNCTECGALFAAHGPQVTCGDDCARRRRRRKKSERDRLERQKDRGLEVACDDCGASVGEPCPGRYTHEARRLAAARVAA